MYYISEEFNNACNDYVRTWHSKCVVNEGKANEITLVNNVPQNCLGAMTWESSINADDALAMGQTGMDKLTMEVTMMNNYNLQGAKLHPYVGIEINRETVWCPLGVFYVENVETDDIYFKQTVTAYDTMSILEDEFNEVDLGITFPISVKDLLQAIATRFNVGINVDTYTMLESADEYILQDNAAVYLIVDKTTEAIENAYAGSYRDYIGWMAGLYGCNAHMDRDGNIAFKYYVDGGVRITPNIIYTNGLTLKRGGTVTYTSLVSGTQENPVYPTRYTGNAITFTNPYITTDDLDAIGDDILPITYHPCDIHYRGNPCIDVGDIVTVVDKNNTNYTAYVMQRTLSMTGGLDDNISCFGMSESQAVIDKSPTERKIKQLYSNFQEAVAKASDYINNTKGVFEWIDNGDGTNGGFNIFATNGTSLLRATAGGIGVSLDGGQTFQNAITSAGINASIIRTGVLNADQISIEQSGGSSNISMTSGQITFSSSNDLTQAIVDQRGIVLYNDGVEYAALSRSYTRYTDVTEKGISIFLQKPTKYFSVAYDSSGDGTFDTTYFTINTLEGTHSSDTVEFLRGLVDFKGSAVYFDCPVHVSDGQKIYLGNSASNTYLNPFGGSPRLFLDRTLNHTFEITNTDGSAVQSIVKYYGNRNIAYYGYPYFYSTTKFQAQSHFNATANFFDSQVQFWKSSNGDVWLTANGQVDTSKALKIGYSNSSGGNTSCIELSNDNGFRFTAYPTFGDGSGWGGCYFSNTNNYIEAYGQGSSMYFHIGGQSGMTLDTSYLTLYVNLNMNGHSILNQSDIRLKENVSVTPVTALDTIDRMRFVEFDWKEDGRHDDLGLIAQELQKINPSMVVDTGEYLAVDTSKFIMYSLKAIQELSAEVKRLKEQKNG